MKSFQPQAESSRLTMGNQANRLRLRYVATIRGKHPSIHHPCHKNTIFAGHGNRGNIWAPKASLSESCELGDADPDANLHATLSATASHNQSAPHLADLMPWALQKQ
jgi:hypothetical protein